MTANNDTTARPEYYPVLVRADFFAWMENQEHRFDFGDAPPTLTDVTHCPGCGADVESLWLGDDQLKAARDNEALALTPYCDKCITADVDAARGSESPPDES